MSLLRLMEDKGEKREREEKKRRVSIETTQQPIDVAFPSASTPAAPAAAPAPAAVAAPTVSIAALSAMASMLPGLDDPPRMYAPVIPTKLTFKVPYDEPPDLDPMHVEVTVALDPDFINVELLQHSMNNPVGFFYLDTFVYVPWAANGVTSPFYGNAAYLQLPDSIALHWGQTYWGRLRTQDMPVIHDVPTPGDWSGYAGTIIAPAVGPWVGPIEMPFLGTMEDPPWLRNFQIEISLDPSYLPLLFSADSEVSPLYWWYFSQLTDTWEKLTVMPLLPSSGPRFGFVAPSTLGFLPKTTYYYRTRQNFNHGAWGAWTDSTMYVGES